MCHGLEIAQTTRTVRFRPNLPLRVLMVPIMWHGYTDEDVWCVRMPVEAGLDELRRRIMPTGGRRRHSCSSTR